MKKAKTTRKAPKLTAQAKARNTAIGKEIKRILEAGGTKTVTKRVYKIKPQTAMKEAVKNMKKFY